MISEQIRHTLEPTEIREEYARAERNLQGYLGLNAVSVYYATLNYPDSGMTYDELMGVFANFVLDYKHAHKEDITDDTVLEADSSLRALAFHTLILDELYDGATLDDNIRAELALLPVEYTANYDDCLCTPQQKALQMGRTAMRAAKTIAVAHDRGCVELDDIDLDFHSCNASDECSRSALRRVLLLPAKRIYDTLDAQTHTKRRIEGAYTQVRAALAADLTTPKEVEPYVKRLINQRTA